MLICQVIAGILGSHNEIESWVTIGPFPKYTRISYTYIHNPVTQSYTYIHNPVTQSYTYITILLHNHIPIYLYTPINSAYDSAETPRSSTVELLDLVLELDCVETECMIFRDANGKS